MAVSFIAFTNLIFVEVLQFDLQDWLKLFLLIQRSDIVPGPQGSFAVKAFRHKKSFQKLNSIAILSSAHAHEAAGRAQRCGAIS